MLLCDVFWPTAPEINITERIRLRVARRCDLLIYPGAFCTELGPPHWSLLGNQIQSIGKSNICNCCFACQGH
ncbi:omega-amidase NIT2-like [Aphis craccivora]|uniref:Omega-amidase NIT2-like n=1 Tax=Aphis craccivora TaxID=307492 RepID=A0A6G0Z2I8_APHCR|nr:omega-amidase NIT2-like [Aphis craccivora]